MLVESDMLNFTRLAERCSLAFSRAHSADIRVFDAFVRRTCRCLILLKKLPGSVSDQLVVLIMQKLHLTTVDDALKVKAASHQGVATEILALKLENASLKRRLDEGKAPPRAIEFVWKKEWAK